MRNAFTTQKKKYIKECREMTELCTEDVRDTYSEARAEWWKARAGNRITMVQGAVYGIGGVFVTLVGVVVCYCAIKAVNRNKKRGLTP